MDLNKEIGIDEWTWLAIKCDEHSINVGDTFQMSTMVNPFIEAFDINADVGSAESFKIRLNPDVKPTHMKMLELYYRGTNYKGAFSPTEFIIDLFTSPDWSIVILLEDKTEHLINIRHLAENALVDIEVLDDGVTEITFTPDIYEDMVTNDIRALNTIFKDDNLFAVFQLIQGSIAETESLVL